MCCKVPGISTEQLCKLPYIHCFRFLLEVRGIMVVAALIDYGIVKRDPRSER